MLSLLKQVILVTGAASGCGLELAKMLYEKNATVYIAARSNQRAIGAIEMIKQAHPAARGQLKPLAVDLADLQTVKPAVASFLSQEGRLDVLVHNAGVMMPPEGSKSKQVRPRLCLLPVNLLHDGTHSRC